MDTANLLNKTLKVETTERDEKKLRKFCKFTGDIQGMTSNTSYYEGDPFDEDAREKIENDLYSITQEPDKPTLRM